MEDIEQCFQVLDLEYGASPQEVEKAYRTLSKVWHPDRFLKENPSLQQKSREKQREINQAYEQLRVYQPEQLPARNLEDLGMIGPGDPPVYLCNPHPDIDLEDGGDMDHHPRHAMALKRKCDETGVEAVLILKDTPLGPENSFSFLLRHFGVK